MILRRLAKLLNTEAAPCIPAGERVYAIGDIHGRLDLLDALLEQIEADQKYRSEARTTLIFLGDLIDRGPDSAGVVERAIALRRSGRSVRFLKGNHEEVFLKAAAGDPAAMRFLIRIGGRATILSYGVTESEYDAENYDDLAALLAARVPAAHTEFLDSCEDLLVIGDYAFVHAGIKPGTPLSDQMPSDLRWIRGDFLSHRGRHEKIIVHGHSIAEEPEILSNRIGIDTGAYASGRLTAIALEGAERWILVTGDTSASLSWADGPPVS